MLENKNMGNLMYSWVKDLFPICRSISGQGVRETLFYIKNILPSLSIKSVKSGTKVFDWTIPKEWNIKDAYIEHQSKKRFAEFLFIIMLARS